jgi:hypothetical protein
MHKPENKGSVEGWEFRRCLCGFVLAVSPRRKLYWLRAKTSVKELRSREELEAALATRCRIYDAPRKATGRSALGRPASP